MTREIYRVKSIKTSLSVSNNRVSAIQKADTEKTGLRIYDNGCIGVAGAIGAYDEDTLAGRAEHMLKFKIPYECEPARDIRRTVDLSESFTLSDEDFVQRSEEILATLARQYPLFSFSHKITYEETEKHLHNNCGAELTCRDKAIQFELLIKHRDSKSMMDSIGVTLMRGFDEDAIYKSISETCACYEEKVTSPEEKMPVIMLHSHEFFLMKFLSDLNGRAMGTEASLFSGKLGQKLFSDDFSLCVQREPREFFQSFFDAEGTVLPDDHFKLIENGILKSPFSSKKIAGQYGYAVTGSGEGEYDSTPDTSPGAIGVSSSGKPIKELLDGRQAIYIVYASGGNFTSQGEYATPVQASFLFDGDELLGRLPQISIRSNVYDMFGKDFIGLSIDGNNPHAPLKYLAFDMNVSRIGDWM